MRSTALALSLGLGISSAAGVSFAEAPAARPDSPPESIEVTVEDTAETRAAAAAKAGRIGYIVGGVVSLGTGIPATVLGILGVSMQKRNCAGFYCIDFSEVGRVMGGISLALGVPGVVAGAILLGVGIRRSTFSSPAPSTTSAVPEVTVGLGQVSARWTF